ncbi:MAG: hypothetical protein QOI49_2294 [Verrucomicrobiota bacterium]|jgi:hypothetical protein
MEFSELKMIWDSQNQEPLYAMNEAALQGIVQRKNQEWNRSLSCCFTTEITIGLICGALMLVCAGMAIFGDTAWLAALPWIKVAPSRWDVFALLAAGGIWFYYSAYMFLARKRQQRRVEVFDSTLRGDLDRALAETDFRIAHARSIVWWGLVPVWVATSLWLAVFYRLLAMPAWSYVFIGATMLGSFVVVVSGKQKSITNRFEPRRRELESLRTKLADPQR